MNDDQLIERIKEYVNKIIADAEEFLGDDEWFSDVYRDKDGMPSSYGNFDDCYDDGYECGEKSGQHEVALSIFNMIKNKA